MWGFLGWDPRLWANAMSYEQHAAEVLNGNKSNEAEKNASISKEENAKLGQSTPNYSTWVVRPSGMFRMGFNIRPGIPLVVRPSGMFRMGFNICKRTCRSSTIT